MKKYGKKQMTRWLPRGLVLLQGLLYGFGDPISKQAYDVMPVYALLSLRYILALAFLMAFFGKRIVNGLRACAVRDWLLSCLCIAGAYLVGNMALSRTAATSVAFLRSLSTVMTPLLAFLLFHRKYGWRHIVIQLAVVVGLYLLCARGGLSGFGAGEVLALCGALLLAGSLVFGERSLCRVEPVALTAVQTAASAVITTVCAACSGGWHMDVITPKVGGIIAYLAVLCTVTGYMLQNTALRSISARAVALLQCFCPVMTAFFSFLVLGERLSAAGIVGAVIILSCVIAETCLREPASEG